MYYWQPVAGMVWQVSDPMWTKVLWSLFGLGWVLVLISTFLTDHFDLFGLRQTWLHFAKKDYTPVKFTEQLFYSSIRHPMMLGLIIAFWATPMMTMSHLVFAIAMTGYIIIGIHYEEKGLSETIGDNYVEYQKRTSRVLPKVY